MNTTTEASSKPEFFRLPTRGGDPHFGLTRPWYYAAEARGDLRMVRLRERGKVRGVTLIPFDAVSALIHRQAREQEQVAASTGGSQ